MKPLVNLSEVPLREHRHGERYAARLGAIAPLIGARKLGCRIAVVPPGSRAWPFHSHYANEELFLILEGSGTLRMGNAEYPLRSGDLVCAPAGGLDTAHQIVNTSSADLRYLCISTMLEPDVTLYPDSGKFGVFAGAPPGGRREARLFEAAARLSDRVDYWEGED